MPAHTSFRSGAAFRRWLAKHHATDSELLVRLFKVHAAQAEELLKRPGQE